MDDTCQQPEHRTGDDGIRAHRHDDGRIHIDHYSDRVTLAASFATELRRTDFATGGSLVGGDLTFVTAGLTLRYKHVAGTELDYELCGADTRPTDDTAADELSRPVGATPPPSHNQPKAK